MGTICGLVTIAQSMKFDQDGVTLSAAVGVTSAIDGSECGGPENGVGDIDGSHRLVRVNVPLRVSVAINRLDGRLDLGEDTQFLCHV
jgi:hypothetical protein